MTYRTHERYAVGAAEIESGWYEVEGSRWCIFAKPEEYWHLEVRDDKGHERWIPYPGTKEDRQVLIDLLIVAFGLDEED